MRIKTICVVVLFLLAAPRASAMKWGVHKIPLQIRGVFIRIFEEIEKEFDTLREDHRRQVRELKEQINHLRRNNQRRVLELKSELRSAHSKITRLETQMTLFKIRLSAIEAPRQPADVAAPGTQDVPPAGGGEGAPARPATPRSAQPTPLKPDIPEPAELDAEIAEVESKRAEEFLILNGSVKNTGETALTFVIVKAVFLDREGKTVTKAATYTRPRVIAPKESASFQLAVRADPRIRSHRLSLQAD